MFVVMAFQRNDHTNTAMQHFVNQQKLSRVQSEASPDALLYTSDSTTIEAVADLISISFDETVDFTAEDVRNLFGEENEIRARVKTSYSSNESKVKWSKIILYSLLFAGIAISGASILSNVGHFHTDVLMPLLLTFCCIQSYRTTKTKDEFLQLTAILYCIDIIVCSMICLIGTLFTH